MAAHSRDNAEEKCRAEARRALANNAILSFFIGASTMLVVLLLAYGSEPSPRPGYTDNTQSHGILRQR